jgi:hypothetical protein
MRRGGTGRDAEDKREPRTRENPENSTKPVERRTARRGGGEGEQGGNGGDVVG